MKPTAPTRMNREPREPRETGDTLPRPPRQNPFAYSAYFAVPTLGSRLCALCILLWLTMLSAGKASAATRYVWQDSPSPGPPYTDWTTAAHVVQDAVDAAQTGDTVLVAGGVYATGGLTVGTSLLVNRVAIDRAITVESLMGPEVTIIQGYQVPGTINGDSAIRCVYLADGASLSGFTLANGATRTNGNWYFEGSGGGVLCESTNALVSNCVLRGNSAFDGGGGAEGGALNNCTITGNSADYGGGAYDSTLSNCTLGGNSAYDGGGAAGYYYTPCMLNHCTLTGNSAKYGGGTESCDLNNCMLTGNSAYRGGGAIGAYYGEFNHCTLIGNSAADSGGGVIGGTLNNCTVTGNSASESGGGADYSALNNCIVYSNTAPSGPNFVQDQRRPINYSCTTPMPTYGVGNITIAPLFVDYAGGNLRLQSNSPCINAGNNAYVDCSTDLDGRPRIVSGAVDMGAYEFQGPGMSEFLGWLQYYGLPTEGSVDTLDTDLDGHNTWQEWKCWTDPTNPLSVLKLLPPQPQTNGVVVSWQSVLGQSYSVERATNASGPVSLLQSNILGEAGTTSITDTNPANGNPILYRVAVPE